MPTTNNSPISTFQLFAVKIRYTEAQHINGSTNATNPANKRIGGLGRNQRYLGDPRNWNQGPTRCLLR